MFMYLAFYHVCQVHANLVDIVDHEKLDAVNRDGIKPNSELCSLVSVTVWIQFEFCKCLAWVWFSLLGLGFVFGVVP